MRSLNYLLTSAAKCVRREGFACPSCACREHQVVARKWLVTSLCRCRRCHLLFRTPTTTVEENARIYQQTYTEGFTTDLPDPVQLQQLKRSRFAGTEKDYTRYLNLLKALEVPAGGRIFDFGCSWGYGSFQFAEAGFKVEAYEISAPRAAYAQAHLGVELMEPTAISPGTYDVFFSAHVIEHVPSVAAMLSTGVQALKPGGLFVALTPNGSETFRRVNPAAWHQMWGFVHPQLIDDEFLARLSETYPVVVDSIQFNFSQLRAAKWTGCEIFGLKGVELMFAIKKTSG